MNLNLKYRSAIQRSIILKRNWKININKNRKIEKLKCDVCRFKWPMLKKRYTHRIWFQSANENSKLIIQDQLRRYVRLNTNENEISTAHRIGRKPARGEDKRNLIFKLCRRDLMETFFMIINKINHISM